MPRRRHGHASWTVVAAVTAAALAALPAAASTGQEACGTETARHAFRDVASGTTHDSAVSCIVAHRVTTGVTADEYAPAGTVSRAQMASFLHRIGDRTGAVTWGASDRYRDVPDSVHADAIRALASVDVTGGADGDRYRPADRLTRGEMATFLVELHEAVTRKRLPDATDRFTDDTGHRHEADTNRAYAAGLVGGYADGTFRPNQPVRRDQMATFLRRVLDRLVADGHLGPVGQPAPTSNAQDPYSDAPDDGTMLSSTLPATVPADAVAAVLGTSDSSTVVVDRDSSSAQRLRTNEAVYSVAELRAPDSDRLLLLLEERLQPMHDEPESFWAPGEVIWLDLPAGAEGYLVSGTDPGLTMAWVYTGTRTYSYQWTHGDIAKASRAQLDTLARLVTDSVTAILTN